ncbi:MAG TPA: serine hydrolase domain-containing protein [Candidatus Deferrimicrobiaceae bacterium]|jgi:CubicO group peptidase (beta-lactamase class C family)
MIVAAGDREPRFDRALALLDQGTEARAWSAAVLLAAKGDELLLHAAAGGARPDSIFDVASLTKPVTATLFHALVEDGKLPQDGVVHETVPLRFSDPAGETVRFSQLLSHTAGLAAWRPFFDDLRAEEMLENRTLTGTAEGHDRIIRAVLDSRIEAPPGTKWLYSDLGFIVLGRALELAAFEPLDRLLARRLAGPLGMADTGYLPLERQPEDAALRIVPTGWSDAREIEKVGQVDDENAAAMGGVAGHAGVFSTAPDLLRFSREILRARKGEGRVLHRPSALSMCERVSQPPGCPRTRGWDTPEPSSQAGTLFSPHSIGHLGYTGCSLWIDLDREITVVLLTNRVVFGPDNRLIRNFRPGIHDAVMEGIIR